MSSFQSHSKRSIYIAYHKWQSARDDNHQSYSAPITLPHIFSFSQLQIAVSSSNQREVLSAPCCDQPHTKLSQVFKTHVCIKFLKGLDIIWIWRLWVSGVITEHVPCVNMSVRITVNKWNTWRQLSGATTLSISVYCFNTLIRSGNNDV